MRRGDVMGLCRDDVDLVGKTLTVRRTRLVIAGAGVVEGEPTTDRGRRTLPRTDDLVSALQALQLEQRDEREFAGSAYGSCPDCGGEHVVVDELGDPIDPESYSDRVEPLVRHAKLPRIRVARHPPHPR